MIRQSSAARRQNRLANRKASPFSKQSIAHAARVMAPALFALAISSVAHAQGHGRAFHRYEHGAAEDGAHYKAYASA